MSKTPISKQPEERLDAIEAHLAGTLKPVAPRKDFVQHLRGRIHLPPRGEIADRLRDWQTLLIVFSGVLSGALLILTIARAFYHLFGRRNIG
jgi:hypothetical protein